MIPRCSRNPEFLSLRVADRSQVVGSPRTREKEHRRNVPPPRVAMRRSPSCNNALAQVPRLGLRPWRSRGGVLARMHGPLEHIHTHRQYDELSTGCCVGIPKPCKSGRHASNLFQARTVTLHWQPSCSVGIGAYSSDVTAPVYDACSSDASIPVTVIGMLDRNDSMHRSTSLLLT
jgi:hypothetical protein